MNNERRIYVCGGNYEYANWLGGRVVGTMEECNIFMLSGGSDVDPGFYGRKANSTTYSNPNRDKRELVEFNKAKEMGKAIIGICRGSQAICAFSGGLLVQDSSHSYRHLIETSDGRRMYANSTHHQRQLPVNIKENVEVLAWAINEDGENLSPYSWGEDLEDLSGPREVEIAYYPYKMADGSYGPGSIGIQPHPEMIVDEEWAQKYKCMCH